MAEMPGLMKDTKSVFIELFLQKASQSCDHFHFHEHINFVYLMSRTVVQEEKREVQFFLEDLVFNDFSKVVDCAREIYVTDNLICDYVVSWFSQKITFTLYRDATLFV